MAHLHVEIPEYQDKYLELNHYIKTEIVKAKLDDFIVEDGADPEEWKAKYGE